MTNSAATSTIERAPRSAVTMRAIILGVVLSIINCYWIMDGLMWRQTRPTTVSLFVNVVFTLFVLVLLNSLVARAVPNWALRQGELVVVYSMLSAASAIASLDLMQPLVSVLAHPFWFASPENRWDELFMRYVPRYLAVTDLRALEGFYEGHQTMYQPHVLRAWSAPVAVWGAFLFVLAFGMLCINAIVRRDWTEKSKLSFPVIQLPLEMTRPGCPLLRNGLMWWGFGIAAVFDIVNGFHFLYPALPGLGGQLYDLRRHVTARPWTAIGWTPMGLFPFAVGLGFFIPLDLSFSCWFFYLFWKVERIIASMTGWGELPRFPFVEEQMFAAFIGFCIFTLWVSREHLGRVLRNALGITAVDDSDEPISYRWAVVGALVSLALLTAGGMIAGMTWWVSLVFFVIYYALATAVARLRAELGTPVHDLHRSGPHLMLGQTLGAGILGARNLTVMTFGEGFNRAYRGHLMPHQLEGFKLADQTRVSQRGMAWALTIAVVVGIAAGFWSLIDVSYRFQGRAGYAAAAFHRLQSWLSLTGKPDYGAMWAMLVGLASSWGLMVLRLKYVWWPLHPAGFAVSGNWSMNLFWFSLFVAWAVKGFLFRYVGMQSYRKSMPFFMGLILGEFTVGSLWSIYGCIRQLPMYNFLP